MKKYIIFLAVVLVVSAVLQGCGFLRPDKEKGESSTTAENELRDNSQKTNEDELLLPFDDGKTVVCLDAGHGFRDVGCDTELLHGTESEVTLAMVLLLKKELESRGIEVILTHDGESFPSCEEIKTLADKAGVEYKEDSLVENDVYSAYERAIYTSAIAEDRAVDLFISLHVNSIDGHPEISRYEIDYYEGNPYAGFLEYFCSSLKDKLEKDTVVFCDSYEDAFIVTKPMTHPSVLIEMGYATNDKDTRDLNSIKWRKSFVEKIADSIEESLVSFDE